MFRVNEGQLNRWLLPLLAITAFFAVILLLFPFNSGDSALRHSLGSTLWADWTATGDAAPDYSYCLLVPAVVAYVVYEKRRMLSGVPARGSTAAIGWVLLGLVLFWIGSKAGKQYVGCVGIQVLLLGLILWVWGGRMFRSLFFAWAFLAFAWPWPFIDTTIAFPMRMIVSRLAFYTVNLMGIPTIQDGTALKSSPDPQLGIPLGSRFQIDIADPCSGIHSLLALLMFSACFSYAFLPRLWQQWTVFLSALPLVILGNVVRILLLVLGCLAWGPLFAVGTNDHPSWYHEGCGYLVFVIVLGLECLLGFFLINRDAKRTGVAPVSPPIERPSALAANPPSANNDVPLWRSGVVFGLVVVALIVSLTSPSLTLSPHPGVLMNLPEKVTVPELAGGGEFFGTEAQVSDVELRMLPKDTEYARKNYDDFNGHNIYFSIVLSGKQQYVIHPPQVCLVAQGWTITKEENVPIRLNSGHELVVRNLSLERDAVNGQNQHSKVYAYYMYWYVADGVSTPSREERNWISSRDRVFKNQDLRWAYVIAMSVITKPSRPGGLDPAQTKQMLAGFIRQIDPSVQKSEAVEGERFGGN